jgi:SNF2 family DNA or RNA helicase
MKTLYDWQEADVTEALAHDSWFLAYEMGLGKTLVSVEWAKRKGAEVVIVVAPLNTRRSWINTIKEQLPGTDIFMLENKPKHVLSFKHLREQKPGWYIVGWEMMRTGAITSEHADLIIADEVHRATNMKALQTELLREFTSEYKLALSGTPAGNRPEGLWAVLNWLWPDLYKSYWKWIERYWRTIRNGSIIELVRELEPGAIVRDMPMFTRRLAIDHANEMPDSLPEIPISVELSPAQRKIYDKLAAEAGVWLDDDSFMSTAYTLVEDIRLRQIALAVPTMATDESTGLKKITFAENAASTKIDALIDLLKDMGDEPFLVLTHSAEVIPLVVSKLQKKGIDARGYRGDTKKEDRDWLVENIGKGYRALVASIAAIGEGVDGLQHGCNNGFWLSKHPNALLNTQAVKRLARPGQTKPVNWWYCYAEDTVDVRSIERLDEIQESLDAVIDR